jgi:deoxyhypusine synthase
MARDDDCMVVLTISGAMTVAKQGRVICDMINRGLVHAVVSTGALIAHGLTESIGLTHYRYSSDVSDQTLFEQGYNRVYDTLEMEANLNDVEAIVREVLNTGAPPEGIWSSAQLCRALGQKLSEVDRGPGVLRSAFERDVPVFIPAFTDSEMGLDMAVWAMAISEAAVEDGPTSMDRLFQSVPAFNPFLDLRQYASLLGQSKRVGIFTVGGGVPRNWAQQVGPFFDVASHRLGVELPAPRFQYGVRICPEPVHWGGLSGCTYSEGISWGKFISPTEGGRYAEVYADATLVWPLLIKGVLEALESA